jgi:hypothetical protein
MKAATLAVLITVPTFALADFVSAEDALVKLGVMVGCIALARFMVGLRDAAIEIERIGRDGWQ